MADHSKEIVNTAALVIDIGEQLENAVCDHQAYFLIVLDDHAGAMPCVEDLLKRPRAERKRAADVLRVWAARIEKGAAPATTKA